MVGTLFYSQLLSACIVSHLLAFLTAWRFVDFHIKVGCNKVGQQKNKKKKKDALPKSFASPSAGLCNCKTISLSFFMKGRWWRIEVLVNINTALASITKPWAINTEEWLQPSMRFRGGHCCPPPAPHPSFSMLSWSHLWVIYHDFGCSQWSRHSRLDH